MPSDYSLDNPIMNGWTGRIVTPEDSEVAVYAVSHENTSYTQDTSYDNHLGATAMFSPWSDGPYHDIFQRRVEVTAAASDRTVFGVGNPGVEPESPKMTRQMKATLLEGDLQRLNNLQWDALEASADKYGLSLGAIDRLAYSSLAAQLAAKMAASAPTGVHIEQLHLFETAGLYPKSLAGFVLNYLKHGGDNWDYYMKANPEWVQRPNALATLGKQTLKRPAGLTVYPKAMYRMEPAEVSVMRARERGVLDDDCQIVLLNGSRSEVSRTSDNDKLAWELGKLGFSNVVRVIVDGGTHGMHDSMFEVDRLVRAIEPLRAHQ